MKLALSEIELKRCEKELTAFMERRRPPTHIRDQVDVGSRIDEHSIEIFEIRPDWKDFTVKYEAPVAKATFVRSRGVWKVYWMRQDLKWHSYQPKAEVNTVKEFLGAVDRDEHCCFWG
jgi:hypothetical protein